MTLYKTISNKLKLTKKPKKENYDKLSIEMHKKYNGKLEIVTTMPIKNKRDLSIAYTPGVAEPCREIVKNPSKVKELVINGTTIGVITDGSAVLGLGNIGPFASLPVMEGKAALFKEFGGLNAFPIAIDTQDVEEFIKTVKNLAPSFAGINLEDISAPRCFEIEERLKKELNIPVFHDDQHGTAVVVLAGLINALKLTNKNKETAKVVVNGAGSGGIAITKILYKYGFRDIIVCDSKGVISRHRTNLEGEKLKLLTFTNPNNICCNLLDAMVGADIFIGASMANLLKVEDIKLMKKDSIVIGLANPDPEIKPELAKLGGAKIIATGRSDYPNQINNVLVFPGIFKGALEVGATDITDDMKIAAAVALAKLVKKPTVNKIIPSPFEPNVADTIAKAVKDIYLKNKK